MNKFTKVLTAAIVLGLFVGVCVLGGFVEANNKVRIALVLASTQMTWHGASQCMRPS